MKYSKNTKLFFYTTILSILNVGFFFGIVWVLESDFFGALKYHTAFGIFIFINAINSLMFLTLYLEEEK